MRVYQGTKEAWDAFVAANAEDGGVLQSWAWGEMEEKEGHTTWRLAWEDGGDIIAVCLLVERKLPFGFKYLYAPRGPVLKLPISNSQLPNIASGLETFVREQKAVFVRIEPPYQQVPVTRYPLLVTSAVQPRQTLRVDLTQSEDELLTAMHQKTRYNIRLAEKHRVTVESSKSEYRNSKQVLNPKFEAFYSLLKETAKRDGFALHTEEHYKNLLELPYCLLFTAHYKQTPLATALVAIFGTTAYYLHGASANVHREVMAPYALHWEIMREAKRRGCTVYDLWGVDEKKWPGVTRFKNGFSPETPVTKYVGTFDIPAQGLLYRVYRLWKLFR